VTAYQDEWTPKTESGLLITPSIILKGGHYEL